jgi:hypothetical protein
MRVELQSLYPPHDMNSSFGFQTNYSMQLALIVIKEIVSKRVLPVFS